MSFHQRSMAELRLKSASGVPSTAMNSRTSNVLLDNRGHLLVLMIFICENDLSRFPSEADKDTV